MYQNDPVFAAVRDALRHCNNAAANPPEGLPSIVAAAIMGGTYTTAGIVAAMVAYKLGLDYDDMLVEFGIPSRFAPPKDEVMYEVERVAAGAMTSEAMH